MYETPKIIQICVLPPERTMGLDFQIIGLDNYGNVFTGIRATKEKGSHWKLLIKNIKDE